MIQTDPIADLLTRIRNAQKAKLPHVEIPLSKMKQKISEILSREGFLGRIQVREENKKTNLQLELKYQPSGKPAIEELTRISRPGCRRYVSAEELHKRKSPVAITILSTSKGLMTDQEAFEANLGGELICRVM
jgi:small subunit ribosomal protein S8